MSFLDLKRALPFLITPYFLVVLFITKERIHLIQLKEEITELHQLNDNSFSLKKEAILSTLKRNDYCGVSKELFYVLKFQRNGILKIWATPLRYIDRPYPPAFKPTTTGTYTLQEGKLRWEHQLLGKVKIFEYQALKGVTEPFQLLRNSHSLFSPRLCKIAASL